MFLTTESYLAPGIRRDETSCGKKGDRQKGEVRMYNTCLCENFQSGFF